MNQERMTSSTASSLALPHTDLVSMVSQGKSTAFIMLTSPDINLGLEVINYLHVGVTVKIKHCMLVNGN